MHTHAKKSCRHRPRASGNITMQHYPDKHASCILVNRNASQPAHNIEPFGALATRNHKSFHSCQPRTKI